MRDNVKDQIKRNDENLVLDTERHVLRHMQGGNGFVLSFVAFGKNLFFQTLAFESDRYIGQLP